ncbi:acylphosphatase [Pseudobacteroides cellulosolvens]|uniref:acylphosphatase n=1 Tax=Pseudobacteroides cellulosolvens ATCC 35603 = DSM 2933 TaxID=398512 RepID=A0A0L6JGU4_9FIRM|nr:acylphosphatase [Pseudobacteroides cellulosolvens]KNY24925.1 Acylphosphatase [Pseudobacteroides cellulosolvens ATCC 35603 = DSM 2933]
MERDIVCVKIKISGIVQGVGFRPFVRRLAKALSINGLVKNTDSSVEVTAEGSKSHIDKFCSRIREDAPKNSWIKEVIINDHDICGFENFDIIESNTIGERNTYISPDLSICNECREEFFEKKIKDTSTLLLTAPIAVLDLQLLRVYLTTGTKQQ